MIINILLLLPFCLFIFLSNNVSCDDGGQTDAGKAPPLMGHLSYSDEKWELHKLVAKKLKFNFTQNNYGIGQIVGTGAGNGWVENFVKMGIPAANIDIQFGSENGTLICNYRVLHYFNTLGVLKLQDNASTVMEWNPADYPENSLQQYSAIMAKVMEDGAMTANWREEHFNFEWMEGGGKFNQELEDPECLYSFYKIAMDRDEYDLLRYCAKGYFYRGFDYDDPRASFLREAWILYLMEGVVKCNVSGAVNPQGNYDLVGMGFSLEMIYSDCPGLKGVEFKLSEFVDDDRDGKFMLAGILGSVINPQVQGRMCGPSNVDGKYHVTLRVGHYCTCAKEHQVLEFDMSFDPRDIALPERRVLEEKSMEIMLSDGIIRLPTNEMICDKQIFAKFQKTCEQKKEEMRAVFGLKKPKEFALGPGPGLGPTRLMSMSSQKQIGLEMVLSNETMGNSFSNTTTMESNGTLMYGNSTSGQQLNGTTVEVDFSSFYDSNESLHSLLLKADQLNLNGDDDDDHNGQQQFGGNSTRDGTDEDNSSNSPMAGNNSATQISVD